MLIFYYFCIFIFYTIDFCRRWLGLKQYILCFFVSYCTLKYLFSIIRQVDMHFDTNVTDIIEDNTMFYEGSFMADLQKYYSWFLIKN